MARSVPRSCDSSHASNSSSDEAASPVQVRAILANGRGNDALQQPIPRDFLPGHPKALNGIASRAFGLGLALGISLLGTLLLLFSRTSYHPAWRGPFFFSCLSLFHFLEFYMTASYNTRFANTEAFLLSSNGSAYNLAHSAALAETLLTAIFAPAWQARWSSAWSIPLGLGLVVLGQGVRSAAMRCAGENFNHTVQTRRSARHELVTGGVYAWCRHPSYFGFFWWGLGTQMVLGNVVCFVAYAVVLWLFFSHRIRSE